ASAPARGAHLGAVAPRSGRLGARRRAAGGELDRGCRPGGAALPRQRLQLIANAVQDRLGIDARQRAVGAHDPAGLFPMRQSPHRPLLEAVDGGGCGGEPARDRLARNAHRQAHVAENLRQLLVAGAVEAEAELDIGGEAAVLADARLHLGPLPHTHDVTRNLWLYRTVLSKAGRLSKHPSARQVRCMWMAWRPRFAGLRRGAAVAIGGSDRPRHAVAPPSSGYSASTT